MAFGPRLVHADLTRQAAVATFLSFQAKASAGHAVSDSRTLQHGRHGKDLVTGLQRVALTRSPWFVLSRVARLLDTFTM